MLPRAQRCGGLFIHRLGNECRPSGHQALALREQVAAPISRFNLVAAGTRESHLGHVSWIIRLLRRPISEGRRRLSVRVRPSPETVPWKKSSDGWYDLTDVMITDNAIREKATWGGFGKLKLDVDRRTGDVKFGNFRGACKEAADAVDAKKF
jgi:hypothetical protein